jgi:hypothetical protein
MKIRISRPGSFPAKGLVSISVIIGLLGMCFLVSVVFLHGCVSPRSAPLTPAEPAPVDPIVGDFIVYRIADGELKGLDRNMIMYRVGDIQFNPSVERLVEDPGPPVEEEKYDRYNYHYKGDGGEWPEQTIFYKENEDETLRASSDHPEAIVLNDRLYFYYTNKTDWDALDPAYDCGISDEYGDLIPDVWGSAASVPNFPNCYIKGGVQNPGLDGIDRDVDWFRFEVTKGMAFHARLIANQYHRFYCPDGPPAQSEICKRPVELSLYKDPAGAPLATSRYGMDYYQFDDPEVGAVLGTDLLPGDTATYYLKVEDISNLFGFPDLTVFIYILTLEGTIDADTVHVADPRAYIYKAELQPRRSNNQYIDGRDTFEPDDISTPVEDRWPDCDGIPGTGDEGDWGIYEICYQPEIGGEINLGSQDGAMQYWEVDDWSAIDDGEWFKGEPTNIPTWMGEEAPTVIRHGDELLMWLNIGGTIYGARSLDGLKGLNWDLSQIWNDYATLRPRSRNGKTGDGDPDAPVVSSGVYGFCETSPAGDDVSTMNKELLDKGFLGYIGYPHTIVVSPGSDGILDTFPQEDTKEGNVITSGEDGIINTFFIPSAFQYCPPYYYDALDPFGGYNAPSNLKIKDFPSLWVRKFKGPGNPDAFADQDICAKSDPLYSSTTDRQAYLLGDDEWDSSLTLTPTEYWRKQRCNLFTLAEQFHRCAMGVPDTVAIKQGGDGTLETVEEILWKNNDYLCHDGDTVGICRGNDEEFGIEALERPLIGDDEYCIETDPELGDSVVAICPGDNGVLDMDTALLVGMDFTGAPDPFHSPTNPIPGIDPSEWMTLHDVFCDPACTWPNCSICPGNDGLPYARLDSAWALYYANSPDNLADKDWRNEFALLGRTVRYYYKADLYSTSDDELCIINGEIALCAGPNGYFQAYPLYLQKVIDRWETYEELMDDYSGSPDDCQELTAVEVWDEFYETTKEEYILYQYSGVLHDDAVVWQGGEYAVTTGANGINQSCASEHDSRVIRRFRGKPNQTIILPGVNTTLDTLALRDEKNYLELENDEDVSRIDTGPDGVANTFVIGDDKVEIYLGTARPDMPCILAGPDGMADTLVQGNTVNDTQLYKVGEKTGFDTYVLATPEVVRDGHKLYLYYTGLGWMNEPEMRRPDGGSYNKKGECHRPGLDGFWGDNSYEYSFNKPKEKTAFTGSKERSFFTNDVPAEDNPDFWFSLDNRQGVLLTSRIGVAIADVDCIDQAYRNSSSPEGCWTRCNSPAIDVGFQCSKASESLIPGLGDLLPGINRNCFNYSGSYSPDVWIEYEESDDQPIFHMMLTGFDSEPESKDVTAQDKDNAQVGLARSLDGVHWDLAYGLNPVINTGLVGASILVLEGVQDAVGASYANPTVFKAGDESYGMILLRYDNQDRRAADAHRNAQSIVTTAYSYPNLHGREWLIYAVRKGVYYAGCSLEISAPERTAMAHHLPGTISALIMIIPFILFLGMRLLRKKAHT